MKKELPYGEFSTWPKPLGPLPFLVLPVSVKESPKAKIFLKGLVCPFTELDSNENIAIMIILEEKEEAISECIDDTLNR